MAASSSSTGYKPPSSIIIIGSGVFGVSTAWSLSKRPSYSQTSITLIDRSPFPNPYGSSIDMARIVRADYADPAYATLANKALDEWRKQGDDEIGGQGRYTQSGYITVADDGDANIDYVRKSYQNMLAVNPAAVEVLPSRQAIAAKMPTGGASGDWGYINKRSGWSHAEKATSWVRAQVEKSGRVRCVEGEVEALIKQGRKVTGVRLSNGQTLEAELVIVATGAWSGALVDLRGRAQATGQTLAYMQLSAAETKKIADCPVLLNLSTGMFIVPPTPEGVFRIARHAYGFVNPTNFTDPSSNGVDGGEKKNTGQVKKSITTSLPTLKGTELGPDKCPNDPLPAEAIADFRKSLREMAPAFADRPFVRTRLCWYTDTPNGDFLITYHPDYDGLFMATGGSGHGFKFLPVIGDCIVETVEGRCPKDFVERWAWPKETMEDVVTHDGSRSGKPGLILEQELRRPVNSKL